MDSASSPLGLVAGALSGRAAFEAAILAALHQAVTQRWRRMCWVSPDWQDWPLGDPTVPELLTTWLRQGQGQMMWLASDFRAFDGRLARLKRWRRDWSHGVCCLTPPAEHPQPLRSMLIGDQQVLVEWLDPVRGRGRVSLLGRDVRLAIDWFDAVSQQSTETLPVTTLGI